MFFLFRKSRLGNYLKKSKQQDIPFPKMLPLAESILEHSTFKIML